MRNLLIKIIKFPIKLVITSLVFVTLGLILATIAVFEWAFDFDINSEDLKCL